MQPQLRSTDDMAGRADAAFGWQQRVGLAWSCRQIEAPRRFQQVMTEYHGQNELILIENFFSPEYMAALTADVRHVQSSVSRIHEVAAVSGGHVTFDVIQEKAPAVVALYRSPSLRQLLARVTGRRLRERHCALYYYDQPGDFSTFHYDPEGTYTALIGIVENSSQVLDCRLATEGGGPPRELKVPTKAGGLLIFRGATIWHGVTEMGPNEERIVLSIQFNSTAH